jgi:uncharacterized coiled-coil protein SlyX
MVVLVWNGIHLPGNSMKFVITFMEWSSSNYLEKCTDMEVWFLLKHVIQKEIPIQHLNKQLLFKKVDIDMVEDKVARLTNTLHELETELREQRKNRVSI